MSPFLCISAIEESGRGWRRGLGLLVAGFAHGFAAQFDAMSVVHETVEDAVGDGGVADLLVPLGHGELRGQDGGAGLIAFLADFPEVAPFGFLQGGHGPVINDQNIDPA